MSSHKTDNSHSTGTSNGKFVLESIDAKVIWLTTLAITALVVGSWAVVGLIANWNVVEKSFNRYVGSPARPNAETMPAYSGRPQLQVDELKDYQTYLNGEKKLLDHYGWVDKGAQKVRVPVTVGMEKVIAKGLLPARRSAQ
jgi:hypothetical protein